MLYGTILISLFRISGHNIFIDTKSFMHSNCVTENHSDSEASTCFFLDL